jgi:hypothetical protein
MRLGRAAGSELPTCLEILEKRADPACPMIVPPPTHLKSLYGKTGIRSQAELVRRVLSGPSAYAPTTS